MSTSYLQVCNNVIVIVRNWDYNLPWVTKGSLRFPSTLLRCPQREKRCDVCGVHTETVCSLLPCLARYRKQERCVLASSVLAGAFCTKLQKKVFNFHSVGFRIFITLLKISHECRHFFSFAIRTYIDCFRQLPRLVPDSVFFRRRIRL